MNQPASRRPLPSGPVSQMFRGMSYPFKALGFIRRNKLWPMTMAAIAINVALVAALVTMTFYALIPYLEGWVASMVTWAGTSSFWIALVTVAKWVIWFVAVPAVVVTNFLVLTLVGQAVASPFLDELSEQVEHLVLGSATQPFNIARLYRSVLVACGDLVWGLLLLVIVNVPVLLVSLIPGLGTAVGGIASLTFSALLLAHEFVGLSLARHLVPYRGRWRVVRENFWFSVGLGLAIGALLWVPVVNLVLLPTAAVGGTLLYCDLIAENRVSERVLPPVGSG